MSGYGQAPGQPMMYQQMAPAVGRPRPSVSFSRAVRLYFKNYAVFRGRASRSEFWWTVLLHSLVFIVLNVLFTAITGSPMFEDSAPYAGMDEGAIFWGKFTVLLFLLYPVATFIPSLAITWRRLHDSDKSGGSFFLSLIPYVGALIVVIFLLLPSSPTAWQRFDAGRLPAED